MNFLLLYVIKQKVQFTMPCVKTVTFTIHRLAALVLALVHVYCICVGQIFSLNCAMMQRQLVHLESLDEYWEKMSQDRECSHKSDIQGRAWYLNQDIKIIWSTATQEKPYITISKNWYSEVRLQLGLSGEQRGYFGCFVI